MPNHEVSTHLGPGRRNVRGAGERKREGFRSLLGQNSGKNILGKHFRCSEDRRRTRLSVQHARPRWGGGSLCACRRAMMEGRVAKGMTTMWKRQAFSVYSFSWRYLKVKVGRSKLAPRKQEKQHFVPVGCCFFSFW